MAAQQVVTAPAAVPAGAGRVAVRVAWLAASGLSVALFALSLPPYYRETLTLQDFGDFGPPMTATQALDAFARLGIPVPVYAAVSIATLVLFALPFWAVGALIWWRRPDERGAWLISLILVLFGSAFPNTLDALAEVHPVPATAGEVVGQAGFIGFFLLFFLFPDGRFVPWWTRWTALLLAADVLTVELATGTVLAERPVWLAVPLYTVMLGALLVAPVIRYRRAGRVQRQQLKWVLLGLAGALLGFLVLGTLPELVSALGRPGVGAVLYQFVAMTVLVGTFLLVPATIGIAILRHRLFDIDLIISRALVYGALTAAVVAIYVIVVGGLGALLAGRGGSALSLLATGLVAALVIPLRTRLQRAVNRLVYGDRDDPYAVLSRLGARLEASIAPEAVLPAIVETVAAALKLPYAAIEPAGARSASWGTPGGPVVRLPLWHRHERVGELVASPRAGEVGFSAADRRLLDDLARQAGAAAHAVLLSTDLRRARERLVTAREEERRRLRRDLHDGLGPQLSGQTLTIDAVRTLLRRDPDAADALLVDLKEQARHAVADVRRVVYALRPPALDDLGLLGALRESAARADGVAVNVSAPDPLPPLPAAAEVAAYLIAQEALTNVRRHAGARTCTVSLHADAGALRLEVRDDGHGIGDDRGTGVGLSSMRERAEELGGTLSVGPDAGGGTVVLATLPLGDET